ncbi:MAG TPA: ornithine cyclodeaminase family protein [Candidatus Eisenbacteria bacterium]|nr:ornithine cyclodeaminase family protein [Candidatus Eisenbacteria bacterium]
MLILSEKEVQSLIDIEELIGALERAHIQYSTGQAVMPVRLVVPLTQIHGRITSMPGYLSRDRALGMKVVTYFQGNPALGLPAILASIMLFSAETGKMIAIMDGSYITAIRTACASAMATRALANPATPILGILGAGVQARAHIRALSRIRQLSKIRVYSPSRTSAENLRTELEPEVKVTIEVAGSAEAAVRDADLVVTVTTAKTPIVNAGWLKAGAHVNAVGSHRPDLREIDGNTLARAKVVVDSREAIMAECGDILLAIKEKSFAESGIHGEIGEVLAGAKPGRAAPEEITLYKSVGIAVQDVAAAHLVYQKALEQKVGTHVEI